MASRIDRLETERPGLRFKINPDTYDVAELPLPACLQIFILNFVLEGQPVTRLQRVLQAESTLPNQPPAEQTFLLFYFLIEKLCDRLTGADGSLEMIKSLIKEIRLLCGEVHRCVKSPKLNVFDDDKVHTHARVQSESPKGNLNYDIEIHNTHKESIVELRYGQNGCDIKSCDVQLIINSSRHATTPTVDLCMFSLACYEDLHALCGAPRVAPARVFERFKKEVGHLSRHMYNGLTNAPGQKEHRHRRGYGLANDDTARADRYIIDFSKPWHKKLLVAAVLMAFTRRRKVNWLTGFGRRSQMTVVSGPFIDA